MRAMEFTDFLAGHPASSLVLLRTLTARLRDAERRRVEYGSIDASRRLARLLVELAGPPDDRGRATVDLSLSQSELASLIGASRESVDPGLRPAAHSSTSSRLVGALSSCTTSGRLERFAR